MNYSLYFNKKNVTLSIVKKQSIQTCFYYISLDFLSYDAIVSRSINNYFRKFYYNLNSRKYCVFTSLY
jgi:hypothetical protein